MLSSVIFSSLLNLVAGDLGTFDWRQFETEVAVNADLLAKARLSTAGPGQEVVMTTGGCRCDCFNPKTGNTFPAQRSLGENSDADCNKFLNTTCGNQDRRSPEFCSGCYLSKCEYDGDIP